VNGLGLCVEVIEVDDEKGLGVSVDGVLREANDGLGLGLCHGGAFKTGADKAGEAVDPSPSKR
jgi:hypothetical protein